VGACVATVTLVLVSAASAQPTGSADLSVTKTGKPRVVTGENQIFTIRVTDQCGDTARDVLMRNQLPDEVSQILAGPVGARRWSDATARRSQPGASTATLGPFHS
jgi:Domain of unknown function DUF11